MKTPNQKEFLRIVTAYLNGIATPKQDAALKQYFELFSEEEDVLDGLEQEDLNNIRVRIKSTIDERITKSGLPIFKLYGRYISAAAAILVMMSIGLYYYKHNYQTSSFKEKAKMLNDIAAGSNKAVLTLANGAKISLTGSSIGKVAEQDGSIITKNGDGMIAYNNANVISGKEIYNSVSTPRGGQYQLKLPDGTIVWLNAASVLTYPVKFIGKERKVELTGEAYFEVVKNSSKPFKVVTNHQIVEVLGTHFNINDYDEEPEAKTSLIEGSVLIRSAEYPKNQEILVPGEQAVLERISKSQPIRVNKIDIEEAIAWKNGYFLFDNEPLESILRKISRWYDVDIDYQGLKSNKIISLSGTLSKYSNASQVLKKLELTGSVQFKIEGRRILVTQ